MVIASCDGASSLTEGRATEPLTWYFWTGEAGDPHADKHAATMARSILLHFCYACHFSPHRFEKKPCLGSLCWCMSLFVMRAMLPLLTFLLILPVAAFELFEPPLPTAIQGGNLERKNHLTHAAIPLITEPARINADLLLKRSLATCGYISGNAGMSSISLPPLWTTAIPANLALTHRQSIRPDLSPRLQLHLDRRRLHRLGLLQPDSMPRQLPHMRRLRRRHMRWSGRGRMYLHLRFYPLMVRNPTFQPFGWESIDQGAQLIMCPHSSAANPSCLSYARSASLADQNTDYSLGCGANSGPILVLKTTTGGGGGGSQTAAATSGGFQDSSGSASATSGTSDSSGGGSTSSDKGGNTNSGVGELLWKLTLKIKANTIAHFVAHRPLFLAGRKWSEWECEDRDWRRRRCRRDCAGCGQYLLLAHMLWTEAEQRRYRTPRRQQRVVWIHCQWPDATVGGDGPSFEMMSHMPVRTTATSCTVLERRVN